MSNDMFASEVDNVINKILKEYKDFLSDEQKRQILAAYVFGVLSGIASKFKIEPANIQAKMIIILIDKFNYSEEQAGEFSQYLIESTDRDFQPVMFAIIHRGLDSYLKLKSNNDFKLIYNDLENIVKKVSDYE